MQRNLALHMSATMPTLACSYSLARPMRARHSGRLCLSGGYESGVSILRRHRRGRLDIRQAASRGSSEYRSGGGLGVGELADKSQ